MTDRNKINNFGYVSRMDNLQAAILSFRINNLDKIISQRRKNFNLYNKYIKSKKVLFQKKKLMNLIHTTHL